LKSFSNGRNFPEAQEHKRGSKEDDKDEDELSHWGNYTQTPVNEIHGCLEHEMKLVVLSASSGH
jgi:hypothetical protein